MKTVPTVPHPVSSSPHPSALLQVFVPPGLGHDSIAYTMLAAVNFCSHVLVMYIRNWLLTISLH